MRLLLCLRYGAGRYIMIKANFQALRLCALIIPAEIRVCIIAAKTRANIDHLYAALPHAGKINCPLPFAHINSPISSEPDGGSAKAIMLKKENSKTALIRAQNAL